MAKTEAGRWPVCHYFWLSVGWCPLLNQELDFACRELVLNEDPFSLSQLATR